MDELQKFENWINENCYMNGGRLQVYGTIRRDVATYYKENQAKNNEVLDLVIWRCTHSVLDIDGDNAFTKGNIYEELDGWLIDNNGDKTELSLFEDNFNSI